MLAIIADRFSRGTISISVRPASAAALANISDSVGYRLRRGFNYSKEYTCRAIWALPALFPITNRSYGETERIGKSLLG
jgi:hypothetical protein